MEAVPKETAKDSGKPCLDTLEHVPFLRSVLKLFCGFSPALKNARHLSKPLKGHYLLKSLSASCQKVF